MNSHGPTTITCHCGQTLQVRHVWQHLNTNHGPIPEEPQPFDYSTLDLNPEPDRKEEPQ